MNRTLQILNLLGVAILAALAVAQWRANRETNLAWRHSEKLRLDQAGQMDELRRSADGCASDLSSFREQLVSLNSTTAERQARLLAAERAVEQLRAEREQLQHSVTNWAQAVAVRDDRLLEMNEHLQAAARDRNAAVEKFNEIAGRFNSLATNLNARTEEYNALAEKYNALVKATRRSASQ